MRRDGGGFRLTRSLRCRCLKTGCRLGRGRRIFQGGAGVAATADSGSVRYEIS